MSDNSAFDLLKQIAESYSINVDAKSINTMPANMAKLALTPSERQNVVKLFPADVTSKFCSIAFPQELTQTLNDATLMLRDPVTKRFTSSISGSDLLQLMQLSSAVTIMTVAAQQQYLSQIDEKLSIISQKIDRILEFLYGEKKAELLAEITFSRYAYENFASISKHEAQRIATINSLQDGKKIALKDIEFYISDLDSTVRSADSKIPGDTEKKARQCLSICGSIDMSVQLYTLNCLLEVYYSQNNDREYIAYLLDDIRSYAEKCDKRLLQDLSMLKAHLSGGKLNIPKIGKTDTRLMHEIDGRIDDLNNHKIGDKQKELLEALHAIIEDSCYVISADGDVFIEQK